MNLDDAIRYLEKPNDKFDVDKNAHRLLIELLLKKMTEMDERLKKLEDSQNEKRESGSVTPDGGKKRGRKPANKTGEEEEPSAAGEAK